MRLEQALERFTVQLEADGRSPHTIHQYERHVRALGRWLQSEGRSRQVAQIDHEDVALFLASPAARTRPDGKAKKATSTNALRTSTRVFFGYCVAAGFTRENAARLVRRARCGSPPPRALSEEEQERLLAVLRDQDDGRDYALFHTMLATGLRVSDAAGIQVQDVDLDRAEIIVWRSKGDRTLPVLLGQEIMDHLRRYIGDRSAGGLFPTRTGRPMSTRHVRRRMLHWLKRAGIKRKLSPHSLRHSFALSAYRRCGDVLVVKELLHHRSLESTLVYARADQERLRQVVSA